MNILFKTIHGSRLYGLAHEDSDYDYYTVVDRVLKKKAKFSTHTIVDGTDSVVVDFGTWVDLCTKGVPQALEAMFSTKAEIDHIPEFRSSFHTGSRDVWDRYSRTIKSFIMQDDFKHKRHGLRLALNLKDLREYGRFNPTLTPVQIELINSLATLPAEHVLNDAIAIAWKEK